MVIKRKKGSLWPAGRLVPPSSLLLGMFVLLTPTVQANGKFTSLPTEPSRATSFPLKAMEVRGRITSQSDGSGLIGVTVVEKGTTNGTSTDINGNFSLTVSGPEAILVVSFIGFTSKEVPVGSQREINIILVEDTKTLDEVVVVGYGTQKKASVTGSVASVKGDEISRSAVTGVGQAIQGKVAGVQITRSSGAPGAGVDIRIRGEGTLNSGKGPLVIIDGIEGRDMNSVSPKDIESVTVLKDASASAIYGSRAANGVIVVTTKRGVSGKTQVDYSYVGGISEIVRMPQVLNAKDYARLQNESLINANKTPTWSDEQIAAFGEGTDWLDAILETGYRQEHNLSLSGGTEKLRYLLSTNYLDEEGILKHSFFERITGRLNLDAQLNEKLALGLSAFVVHRKSQGGPGLHQAIEFSPTIPLTMPDGSPGYRDPNAPANSESGGLNPLHSFELGLGYSNFAPYTGTNSSIFVEYSILPELKFRTTGSLDVSYSHAKSFNPSYQILDATNRVVGERLPQNRQLNESADFDRRWLVNNVLTYTKSFGQHNTSVMLGHSEQYSDSENFTAQRTGFPSNDFMVLNAGSNLLDQVSGNRTEYSLRSFFGRVNYDFNQKYLLELVGRYDGSSRFSPDKKYGFFPSASVGWRISEESFFEPMHNAVNDLKFRASYGAIGNESIPNFIYLQNIGLSTGYAFNNNAVQTAAFSGLGNPGIQWETSLLGNVGFDMSLFKNRLTINLDAYWKTTKDILTPVGVPSTTGHAAGDVNIGTQFRNVGKVLNKGLEVYLAYQNTIGKDWSYDISATGAYNRNEILELGEGNNMILSQAGRQVEMVGFPIGSVYGWRANGVWQSKEEIDANPHQPNDQPGDLRLVDINGDGVVDGADRVPLGSSLPLYTLGINGNLKFRNFDFNVSTQGDFKRKVLRYAVGGYFELAYPTRNTFDYALNRWRGEGTSNLIPRVVSSEYNTGEATSLRVQDASYFKIRHLEFGYTLPEGLLSKVKISNLRVYVAAENLHTFTPFVGLDPERPGSVQRQNDTYPQAKMLLGGINVSF